jgi:hypothetical protein
VKCPRCNGDLHIVPARNATSRLDGKTRICSDCGNEEAMFNHFYPDRPLPPIDERVITNVR